MKNRIFKKWGIAMMSLILSSFSLVAQDYHLECWGYGEDSPPSILAPSSASLTGCDDFMKYNTDVLNLDHTPTNYIRVNFHFTEDTSTGGKNFTANGDGHGNDYNGEDFAKDLIRWINWRMELKSPEYGHLSSSPLPAVKPQIGYVLTGVYYHDDPNAFDPGLSFGPLTDFIEDSGESINIFISGVGTSNAGIAESNAVSMHGIYKSYEKYGLVDGVKDFSNPLAYKLVGSTTKAFLHELGHSYGLNHNYYPGYAGPNGALFGPPGCDDSYSDYDDGIPDTPTRDEVIADRMANGWDSDYWDPCPTPWNGNGSSGVNYQTNNLMSTNPNIDALTPGQLGKWRYSMLHHKKAF